MKQFGKNHWNVGQCWRPSEKIICITFYQATLQTEFLEKEITLRNRYIRQIQVYNEYEIIYLPLKKTDPQVIELSQLWQNTHHDSLRWTAGFWRLQTQYWRVNVWISNGSHCAGDALLACPWKDHATSPTVTLISPINLPIQNLKQRSLHKKLIWQENYMNMTWEIN